MIAIVGSAALLLLVVAAVALGVVLLGGREARLAAVFTLGGVLVLAVAALVAAVGPYAWFTVLGP